MRLSTRLLLAMTLLVLLTAGVFGSLTYPVWDAPALALGLAAILGILILAVLLAHALTRALVQLSETLAVSAHDENRPAPFPATGEVGIIARAFERMRAEMHARSDALRQEIEQRRLSDTVLQQYAERERSYIAVVETASYPVITKTLGGIITAWNPAAERLYQYTAAEATGNSIDMIVPADRRGEHLSIVNKTLKGEPIENFETVRVAKDGRRIDVSINVCPVKSAAGVLAGVATIARDITAEKFAEEKFRLAVESCPSGMMMSHPTGRIVMVNTEIERLFGYSREELIGQTVSMLMPERLRAQHAQERKEFAARPETRRIGAGRELLGLRKDGTEFPVEVGLNPIHAREGLLVLSVIVDITERKRLERLKDEFVSTVSHELRTPLTSISGSLSLLIGNAAGALPEAARRLLAIAHSNSQRLIRLINDILDIEKMKSGQVVFDFKRVDLRSLVEQTVEANRGFADSYGVRIRFDAADGAVRADPDRLAQVVTNLLSNAIKFSPPDHEVVVAIEQRDEAVRLSVRNDGPGIDAEFKPHVFEKFAQADATHGGQKGGTGLGLNIVKQIVDRLGGKVWFDDAAGGGTVFHVELPCWKQIAGTAIDTEAPPDALRIFLCDDDPDTVIALRQQLRQLGFATDVAYTVSDALACAAANRYHAVLVDLKLPDGDGLSLILRLRELPPYRDTPIIVLSADPERARNDDRSSSLKILDWLSKPVDLDRLLPLLGKNGRGNERAGNKGARDPQPPELSARSSG
jgi:PAS domain S-box-containing protein